MARPGSEGLSPVSPSLRLSQREPRWAERSLSTSHLGIAAFPRLVDGSWKSSVLLIRWLLCVCLLCSFTVPTLR